MIPADTELYALLSLLESEGPASVAVLLEQVRSFPEAQIRRLLSLTPPTSPARRHLELVLAQHESARLCAALEMWVRSDGDLERGMTLIARTGYPLLRSETIPLELDTIAQGVRERTSEWSGIKGLKSLIYTLRATYSFRGNATDYQNPDNSYLNRVLEQRTGLPITLTVVYMLLGARLGLEIRGIPLPGHFIACFVSGAHAVYFDPFGDGAVLEMRDVMAIVNSAGFIFHPDNLRPATSVQIARRTLGNLESAYRAAGDDARVALVQRYATVLAETG